MTTMAKKKNTRTIPIGSKCKYSFDTRTWKNQILDQWHRFAEDSKATHRVVIRDGDVGLDTEWPVNMKDVLIERQHEHNQHKQCIEHCKEEHRFVSQLFQSSSYQSLQYIV